MIRWVFFVMVFVFAACGTEPGPPGSTRCTPGTTAACLCPSGTGAQSCLLDGSGYGACQCASPDAAVTPDASMANPGCAPCGSDAQCPGSFCGRRFCDGRAGCAPAGGMAACNLIGGVACPAVAAYRQCSSSAQCGAGSACVPVYPGETTTTCQAACATHADCPPVPMGSPATPFCDSGTSRCKLACTAAGMCTSDGLTCRRSITGSYSYCL